MTALTLPGDIPGLLRRGSPLDHRGRKGAAFSVSPLWAWFHGLNPLSMSPADVTLDLSDATGRAHAAWWLLNAHTAKADGLSEQDGRDAAWCLDGGGGWTIRQRRFCSTPAPPDLSQLDQDDPRTLADGSPWVDAEALRLVCLHVAGR